MPPFLGIAEKADSRRRYTLDNLTFGKHRTTKNQQQARKRRAAKLSKVSRRKNR